MIGDDFRHPTTCEAIVDAMRNLCLALDFDLAMVSSIYGQDCRDAYVYPAGDVVQEIRAHLDELERLFAVFIAGPPDDGNDPPRQPGQ